jgi:addiction module HigA family antidote
MMSRMVEHPNPLCPGHLLRKAMKARQMSQRDLAWRLKRPTKTISEICTGKTAITPETALQLEALFPEIPALMWLYRQAQFQLDEARHDR